jgi:L-ascorbate metabolism protein UlaG (beta-lactamase superfamily)
VAAAQTLQSRVTLPIHYGTIPLADDGFDEPLRALKEALASAGGLDFRIPEFGQPIDINR